jgi:hypothetical protein
MAETSLVVKVIALTTIALTGGLIVIYCARLIGRLRVSAPTPPPRREDTLWDEAAQGLSPADVHLVERFNPNKQQRDSA